MGSLVSSHMDAAMQKNMDNMVDMQKDMVGFNNSQVLRITKCKSIGFINN